VILKAVQRGVLVLDAGRTVVRLLPPLVIRKQQVDKAVSVLDEILGEEKNERAGSTVSN
jgi:4-aminobutyrate aminotransferase-like enzyme